MRHLFLAALFVVSVHAVDTAEIWPSDPHGLVFCYRTKNSVLAFDKRGKERQAYSILPGELEARGMALCDRNDRLLIHRSSYLAKGIGDHLLSKIRAANAFAIETVITPDSLDQGPAFLVALADSAQAMDAALIQDHDQINLLLTTSTPPKPRLFHLGTLAARPTHIAVSVGDGRIAAWIDGKSVVTLPVTGDFSGWTRHDLAIGDEPGGTRPWSGIIDGLAIYARTLSDAEVVAGQHARLAQIAARKQVPRLVVRATLLEKTPVPSVASLAPYWRSLEIYVYQVEAVIEGIYTAARIPVAHWCVFADIGPLPFASAPIGSEHQLVLERFDDNPQLTPEHLTEDVGDILDLQLYYDAGLYSLDWAPKF